MNSFSSHCIHLCKVGSFRITDTRRLQEASVLAGDSVKISHERDESASVDENATASSASTSSSTETTSCTQGSTAELSFASFFSVSRVHRCHIQSIGSSTDEGTSLAGN